MPTYSLRELYPSFKNTSNSRLKIHVLLYLENGFSERAIDLESEKGERPRVRLQLWQ